MTAASSENNNLNESRSTEAISNISAKPHSAISHQPWTGENTPVAVRFIVNHTMLFVVLSMIGFAFGFLLAVALVN